MRAALHAAGVRSEVDGVAGTARISAAPTAIEVTGELAKPKQQRASGRSKRRASTAESDDVNKGESGSAHKAKPPTPKKRRKTVKKSGPKAKPKATKKSSPSKTAAAIRKKKSPPKAQELTKAKRRRKDDFVPDSEEDDY